MPLPVYTPCMRGNDGSPEDSLELVSQYFKQGYTNLEILEFLNLHGINISLSTLKRRLTSLGLPRISFVSNELRSAIEKELGGSGCFVGYRKMWARLRMKGIIFKRARVMTLLRELDPDGIESRRKKRLRRRAYHAKGPNFVWHTDGHNKLKPFGLVCMAVLTCFQNDFSGWR